MDKYVSRQYQNRITPISDRNKSEVKVDSPIPASSGGISISEAHTSHLLPLIFYWQMDYQVTCSLNPAIPIHEFTNALDALAKRRLKDKLNGRELELSIKQLPYSFAIKDRSHMVWLIYAFGWDKVTLEPEVKDMIISYKLVEDHAVVKQGEISVEDKEKSRRLGYFESWKRATSSYIARYNHDIPDMARIFVDSLEKEL